jgi:small conductance mechanosensitive channel
MTFKHASVMLNHTLLSLSLIISCGLLPVHANEYIAVTTDDIEIDIDELEFKLTPLTLEESAVEADAWTAILKKHITIVSEGEILLSKKHKNIKAAEIIAEISDERSELLKQERKSKAEKKELKAEFKRLLAEVENLTENTKDQKKAKIIINNMGESVENSNFIAQKAEAYSDKLQKRRSLLISNLTLLREEKNDILARYNVVLDNWEDKGGDAATLRLYASAISGTTVDLTDGSTAWLTIKGWLLSDDGGIYWLANIIKFVLALIFVYLLSRTAGKLTDAALSRNKNFSSLLKSFIKVSVRRIILGIGFIVSLTIIQINVGPVLALIGAAGLVIGLALQSTLSNFASGMLILIYRPFDVGDVIEINGSAGFVDSMTLLSTSIKTFDNQHLIVPNNSVWGTTIVNVTGSRTRRVDLVFGIGYGDDMEKARLIMVDVLEKHPMVLDAPEAMVKVHQLADSSVNFICRPWVKTENYWDVYWDVTRMVKEQFDLQGVSIPFPQQDVHLHHINANSSTEK